LGLAFLTASFGLVAYIFRDNDGGIAGGVRDGALIGAGLFLVALIVAAVALAQATRGSDQ
jgi:hypothetical protein